VSRRPRQFAPTINPEGTLEPASLAEMGERWVLSWLRERLAGRDPYLPLDRRSGEDPDALVVGLLRSAGPLEPASRLIGRASLRLLREAEEQAPSPPAFLASLLRICQQARLPDTEEWFAAFVEKLADDAAAVEARWSKNLLAEIVYAAIQQTRATPGSAGQASWLKLLRLPRFTTYALIALSSSFEAEVEHLAEWWQACPAAERTRELRQRITRAAKLQGDQRLREVLSAKWTVLPAGLRTAIDGVLGKLGMAALSTCEEEDGHVGRAIRNAALKPELVLQEARRHQAVHSP
jgi:hypothetical protein